MVFFILSLLIGHFGIDLILLQKLGIIYVSLWPQYNFEASEMILCANLAIDHSNFHIEDIDLKFTNTWELLILWASANPHLDRSIDFISDHRF